METLKSFLQEFAIFKSEAPESGQDSNDMDFSMASQENEPVADDKQLEPTADVGDEQDQCKCQCQCPCCQGNKDADTDANIEIIDPEAKEGEFDIDAEDDEDSEAEGDPTKDYDLF